jgi:hypothetical protein
VCLRVEVSPPPRLESCLLRGHLLLVAEKAAEALKLAVAFVVQRPEVDSVTLVGRG